VFHSQKLCVCVVSLFGRLARSFCVCVSVALSSAQQIGKVASPLVETHHFAEEEASLGRTQTPIEPRNSFEIREATVEGSGK
jgi:hypothetical protein